MIFLCYINTFISSQLFANIILLVTAIIAIATYKSDIKQRKMKSTLEYVSLFLEGNWILNIDKKNWNDFFKNRLCRDACGTFSLTGKYVSFKLVDDGIFNKTEQEEVDIINIFSEGADEYYGYSISNVLNMLEFIAYKTNHNHLDIDIIRMRLLRFYQLADFYNNVLFEGSNQSKVYFPEIKKMYKKLSSYFNKDVSIGEYCEFPIEFTN